MHRQLRPRRLARAALTGVLVAAMLVVAACAQDRPNSIFHPRTEFNREVGHLFNILIWAGAAVFVLVEAVLVYTLVRYRRRGPSRQPEHVHGNTTLEILWTIIPAAILVVIAIPTVQTVFRTQRPAQADALQVQVVGHQWWWEFRYPQYTTINATGKLDTLVTADELYLPIGRTVNFALVTKDVLHSFWVPALGGKRDLIANRTNYLWFTPDSTTPEAFNGFCVEFCGASHANMRFKAFVVTPEDFAGWIAHQQSPAAFVATPAAPPGQPGAAAPPAPGARPTAQQPPPAQTQPPLAQAGYVSFPQANLPQYVVPKTPLPVGLTFDERLTGDPARGEQIMSSGVGACLGCHTIRGNPRMIGTIGPNLTHVGSRTTIAAGLFPNDTRHLSLWIKNARMMKPGVVMPTLGMNQYDPVTKTTMKAGGLTDQQIADIVAYLQALK
jgi:cytochrome c oxidase subunit 2